MSKSRGKNDAAILDNWIFLHFTQKGDHCSDRRHTDGGRGSYSAGQQRETKLGLLFLF